ncbi:MAG: D-aminoacyl-tRNA deacylase [Candidatus Micrarchaeota archaeon]
MASKKIAEKLITGHGFRKTGDSAWEREGVKLIDTKLPTVLDVPENLETDYIIMLSTHKSKMAGKMLTAHIPGNWGNAGMGGKERTLNIAPGTILKKIAIEMNNEAKKIGWPFYLEADHHGPTIKIPIIFVEIGNGEEQWGDDSAVEAVANAVVASIGPVKECETVIGFGGGHYQKNFTKIVVDGKLAVGHMAPKYAIEELDEEMFKQAIEKNVEKISKVVVLKDETNLDQKKKIRKLAEKFNVGYEEL